MRSLPTGRTIWRHVKLALEKCDLLSIAPVYRGLSHRGISCQSHLVVMKLTGCRLVDLEWYIRIGLYIESMMVILVDDILVVEI